ncbi:MAG TPA: AIM24 family protein [Gemmatimonadaceae bacterium]|nr:AIM24 family protein [Gemmatimonadaceae bacterium]
MAVPVLRATSATGEQYGGVTYHLEGELVPVLHIELGTMPVYFEHHVLLWKHPAVSIGLKSLKGAFKRIAAGMPVFMTEAAGPGHIAFSRDGAGHVFALHLARGEGVDVREHQFLAATAPVDYTFKRVKGAANMLFGGSGFFIDTFTAAQGDGIVWLHGYGNVFEVTLARGEEIDIESGGWIYKDHSVEMTTKFQRLSTGIFAGGGQVFWNRFLGPGRVGIQSMYMHMPTSE